MKYVSFEKYTAHMESEGWKLDPTTYKEYYAPIWSREVVYRKEGDKRMLVIGVMCKKNKKNPMQMTDVIMGMSYRDPSLGTFGIESIKPNFTKKFWKDLSKEY